MREVQAVEITSFRRDARVKVWLGVSQKKREVESKRGFCREFNSRVRSRLLFTAFNASCDWLAFGFLTYPADFPTDGKVVKRHLDLFRKRLKERGIILFWAIEFQERGAVHINFLIDQFLPKAELSRIWFEIVGSGDEKHLRSGTRIEFARSNDQAAGYMAACYSAKKDKQKTVPAGFENIGRWWGAPHGLVVAKSRDIFLVDDAMPKVRALRRFTEKRVKPRKVQTMKEGKLRDRKVRRKPSMRHLHSGLRGFTVFGGSSIANVLVTG